jgi:ribonuclease T1
VSLLGRSPGRQPLQKLGFAILLAGATFLGGAASAKDMPRSPAESVVSLQSLPAEAQTTDRLIRQGGPFPHAKDGTVFGNRERLLPSAARGYYREYTVRTPRVRHRGARRIVCGGVQPAAPEACYYTDDHYASFRRIVQ